MSAPTEAAILIKTIQENEKVLNNRVKVLKVASPSFGGGVADALLVDPEAVHARNAISDASEELNALMKGPQGILTLPAHNLWAALHVVVRFNLTNAIPVEGDEGRTFDEIAAWSGLDASMVKRILKNVITLHVFTEGPSGTVRHNATSRYLAKTREMQQWIGMVMDDLWPAATQIANALERYPGSQEPQESAFGLAHNSNAGFFGFMAQHPKRFERFADAMTWFSAGPGLEASHLADGYPWSENPTAKVIDIGGSFGAISMAVSKKYSSMLFVVQDRPEVISVAQSRLPVEFAGKLSFAAHDFFIEQPIQDAQYYLLRQIFHDWSDLYAAKIVKALVPALEKGGGKMIIMEQIIPDRGDVSLNLEQAIRSFDLAMLEISNGRERDMSDWRALFASVDKRLHISRRFQPTGSRMGLLEVTLIG